MEQIQLCFKWPGRGFTIDTMRIASIDMDEWEALLAYITKTPDALPGFRGQIRAALPWEIQREDLAQFQAACERLIDYERIDQPEMSALLTLSMFVSQALDQREAIASIEFWEGEYFDLQTFIMPGTDLLADMIEIDKSGEEL
jgi:hypothetical protein